MLLTRKYAQLLQPGQPLSQAGITAESCDIKPTYAVIVASLRWLGGSVDRENQISAPHLAVFSIGASRDSRDSVSRDEIACHVD